MSELEAKLKELRPSLFDISKLEAHIILAYGVFNVLVGPILITLPRADNISVLLPVPIWGVIFMLLGVWMLASLWTNNWQATRDSLLAGITVKTVWLIALLFVAMRSNWSVALLWGIFTWIQIVCYVYFPGNGHGQQ